MTFACSARLQVLGLHPHAVVAEDEHLGVAEPERRRATSRTSSADAEPCPLDRELPLRAALEVDAEVEAVERRTRATEIRISVPESSAQRHERSMNSKCVRSW